MLCILYDYVGIGDSCGGRGGAGGETASKHSGRRRGGLFVYFVCVVRRFQRWANCNAVYFTTMSLSFSVLYREVIFESSGNNTLKLSRLCLCKERIGIPHVPKIPLLTSPRPLSREREGTKEGGGGRKGGRRAGREAGREGGREGEREGGREVWELVCDRVCTRTVSRGV